MAKDYSEDLLIQKSSAELLEKNSVGSLCMLSTMRYLANKGHLNARHRARLC